ncbi:SigE family RNA polymerase sigma factor [Propioniciclava sp. MC1595]|uniref:SigE family RNA polymerase sigma factor n=1 Tax=Propioniciclava sp. MC1595 TaxID=2760308 RepID=UPI001AA1BDE6|nr:SigE family RNA polymerase sigma factor [Propioniciclava sp. MC1595]QTE24828.1 SigE family RNA polymerase sigma factor [Propioniciclava sp. MC1595]
MLQGWGKATRDAEFTAFVEESTPRLVRLGVGLTGSGDAARELVQASLVKTYVAWPRIRQGEAYAYTRRIMANERVDAWRSTRKEVSTGDAPDRPSSPASRTEDHDQLVRLLATLPQRQRAVVVLRYYDDLSEAQVADLLGISVGAVKSAASRGLASLRATHSSHDTTEAGAR